MGIYYINNMNLLETGKEFCNYFIDYNKFLLWNTLKCCLNTRRRAIECHRDYKIYQYPFGNIINIWVYTNNGDKLIELKFHNESMKESLINCLIKNKPITWFRIFKYFGIRGPQYKCFIKIEYKLYQNIDDEETFYYVYEYNTCKDKSTCDNLIYPPFNFDKYLKFNSSSEMKNSLLTASIDSVDCCNKLTKYMGPLKDFYGGQSAEFILNGGSVLYITDLNFNDYKFIRSNDKIVL